MHIEILFLRKGMRLFPSYLFNQLNFFKYLQHSCFWWSIFPFCKCCYFNWKKSLFPVLLVTIVTKTDFFTKIISHFSVNHLLVHERGMLQSHIEASMWFLNCLLKVKQIFSEAYNNLKTFSPEHDKIFTADEACDIDVLPYISIH